MENTIIENGESAELSHSEVDALLKSKVAYRCDDPQCGLLHISPSKTWADVDKIIESL